MPTHPEHPPEWIATAPISVERSVEIAATPAEVWRHVADHESWPDWFGALSKVEVTGEATGVGGRRRVSIKGPSGLDEVFTAWDENERFAFAVVGSKVPFLAALAESVELEPIELGSGDAGCRVTYRQGLELRRGFGWMGSRSTRLLGDQLTKGLTGLKTQVERSPTPDDTPS